MTVKKGETDTKIYDKVKKLAKEKGITIQQMEHDLEIPEGYASKWNRSQPRIATLKKVAEYFDVTIDELAQQEREDTGGGGTMQEEETKIKELVMDTRPLARSLGNLPESKHSTVSMAVNAFIAGLETGQRIAEGGRTA